MSGKASKSFWRCRLTKKSAIFDAICRERGYQDDKWGDIYDHPHTVFEWIGIMEKELSEAKAAFFQRPADPKMLEEVLQVVSVGVACMEQHGIVERPEFYRIHPEQEMKNAALNMIRELKEEENDH